MNDQPAASAKPPDPAKTTARISLQLFKTAHYGLKALNLSTEKKMMLNRAIATVAGAFMSQLVA